jgi:hypothetical protein
MSHSQPSNTQYYPASDMHKNRKNDEQNTPPPLKLAGRQGKMFDLYLVNQQAATKKQSDDHHNIVPCQQFPKY